AAGVVVGWPATSSWIVRSWHTATGATESTTVTVAVQVALLPFASVTVRVTAFVPTLLQSKLVLLRLRLAMPQPSLLPLFTSAGTIVAWPAALSWMVISLQKAVGGVESDTVTVCWQEFVQPVFDTVTVRVKLPGAAASTVIAAPLV